MYHSKGIGSPGRDLELKFNNFLLDSSDIKGHIWLSKNEKTAYDFKVYIGYNNAPSQIFFIDVVGTYPSDKRLRLITAQKNWPMLHEFAEKNSEGLRFREYLAFRHDGLWRFLRVKEGFPSYDIYLSRSAMRGIRDFESIIRDNRPIKTILADSVRGTYKPRAAKMDLLTQWIYTDVRV